MEVITSITSDPKQRLVLKLDNNENAIMHLYFNPYVSSWYYDIEYYNYINRGNKVVLTLNALRHLKKRLPFGISFLAGSNAEPFQLDDFATSRIMMLLLNEEDVQELEDTVYSGEL